MSPKLKTSEGTDTDGTLSSRPNSSTKTIQRGGRESRHRKRHGIRRRKFFVESSRLSENISRRRRDRAVSERDCLQQRIRQSILADSLAGDCGGRSLAASASDPRSHQSTCLPET